MSRWFRHSRRTLPINLSHTALARGAKRGSDDVNLGASSDRGKVWTLFLIVIADQMLGTLSERGGFPQLLSDPFIGGVTGHADVDDPTRTMTETIRQRFG